MNYFVYLCLINKKQRMDNYIVSAKKISPVHFSECSRAEVSYHYAEKAIQSNKLAHLTCFAVLVE